MSKKTRNIVIGVLFSAVIMSGIFITVFYFNRQQDIRSRASNQPDQYIVTQTINPDSLNCTDQADINFSVLRTGGTVSTPIPVDVVLTLDVSSSMIEGGGNPPEPLNSAKNAAKSFVNLLNLNGNENGDRIGLVAYCRTINSAIPLSGDKEEILNAIDNLQACTYTNTALGLQTSIDTLNTNSRDNSKKVIVLLSDGLPNINSSGSTCEIWPTSPNSCTQEVISKATGLVTQNTILFTIGLGFDAVNVSHPGSGDLGRSILRDSVTGESYYYEAPNQNDLDNIYQTIAHIVKDIVTSSTMQVLISSKLEIDTASLSPKPDSVTGNLITWNWPSLEVGQTKTFTVKVSNDYAENIDAVEDQSQLTYVEFDGASREVTWNTDSRLITGGDTCLSHEPSPTPTAETVLNRNLSLQSDRLASALPSETPTPTDSREISPSPTPAATNADENTPSNTPVPTLTPTTEPAIGGGDVNINPTSTPTAAATSTPGPAATSPDDGTVVSSAQEIPVTGAKENIYLILFFSLAILVFGIAF